MSLKDLCEFIAKGIETGNGDLILFGLSKISQKPPTQMVLQCRRCHHYHIQDLFTPAEPCKHCGSSDVDLANVVDREIRSGYESNLDIPNKSDNVFSIQSRSRKS